MFFRGKKSNPSLWGVYGSLGWVRETTWWVCSGNAATPFIITTFTECSQPVEGPQQIAPIRKWHVCWQFLKQRLSLATWHSNTLHMPKKKFFFKLAGQKCGKSNKSLGLPSRRPCRNQLSCRPTSSSSAMHAPLLTNAGCWCILYGSPWSWVGVLSGA